ncbi:hypothetical protein QEH52_18830 [Coraliomargarita sp. SDUM461003]|uniref:Virulence protein n=1 Tax=Thalassobacterium maritimum TaxID=3041265 RepID=A0ABU1AZT0_9BACT|nr:hypothetical protein [Coraliomargarita sp. SDUM461003]MDQ8209586.1 hypothetical protein [Coraliomargarita sp. SDUM461003]
MSKEKKNTDSNRNEKPNIRSSAAEYLSFVAAGGGSEEAVEMRYEDENIWLTQKLMAELYGVSVPAINLGEESAHSYLDCENSMLYLG